MYPIDLFLVDFVADTFAGASDARGGETVRVDRVDLTLPIDVRMTSSGQLLANLPTGRLSTGFEAAPGRLTAHLEELGS